MSEESKPNRIDGDEDSEDIDYGGDAVKAVRTDEKARAMLKVLEESETGRVGTSEFKQETGMEEELHYRYEKLHDAGFIEIDYDSDATPSGVAPMKVAVLTDRGKKAISEGLSGDTADVGEETLEDRVDKLEEQMRENREAFADIYEWTDVTSDRLDELERKLDEVIRAVENVGERRDVAGEDDNDTPRDSSEDGSG